MLRDGVPANEISKQEGGLANNLLDVKLKLRKWLFNLGSERQLEFLVNNFAAFIHLLLIMARFDQIPARITDMFMMLTLAVRRYKAGLLANPPGKDGKSMDGPPTKFGVEEKPEEIDPEADDDDDDEEPEDVAPMN